MDLNKWNRSVGSFDKSAGGDSENCGNCENKIEICKTHKNSTGHDQKEQDNDNDGGAEGNEDESENATTKTLPAEALTSSATIIISPLNRTLLKKPTAYKNANNYTNINDNNNNNKNNINNENLDTEDLQKKRINNINCNENEIDKNIDYKLQNNNDHGNLSNDHQFSKPIARNLIVKHEQHNNFITKRSANIFGCHLIEKCSNENLQNSIESDNEQEQEQQQQSQSQSQRQESQNLQERNNARPVDDVDATTKHSIRNAHITGFETGVVGVCCSGDTLGPSVEIVDNSESRNGCFISNLNKKPNITATVTTTIPTTATPAAITTTASNHNSTSITNEITTTTIATSIAANTYLTTKCHNCCNNNNNSNSSNNNKDSSNYCRN